MDLYTEHCIYLFFAEMTDCKPDFYKHIIDKEFDDIMKELSQNLIQNISNSNETSKIDILIEDTNNSHPIQSLKDNGYFSKTTQQYHSIDY